MKNTIVHLFLVMGLAFIIGCGPETTINDDEAASVISNYLDENPEYKTASFAFGEKDKSTAELHRAIQEAAESS